MANPEHEAILRQGVEVWNQWRKEHPDIRPNISFLDLSKAYLKNANLIITDLNYADLTGADLIGADMTGAKLIRAKMSDSNLNGASLKEASLNDADLIGTNLSGANLNYANLSRAHLIATDLMGAKLVGANLFGAYFSGTNMCDANLNNANLSHTILSRADLKNTDFLSAIFLLTQLSAVNLSQSLNLETVKHEGPSFIDIATLYCSKGKIPRIFLQGVGVPDNFIDYIPSHFGTTTPNQYHSCFISYSHKDEDFAKRLHERMRAASLRVWFAPEDMKGGQKTYDQIDRAIQLHDKLLLVLSPESIKSNWVQTEIRRALKAEKNENRRKLFPIRLCDIDTLKAWECFDADTGKDLAVEVREYHIPDFTAWKTRDAFEPSFARLLADLKTSMETPSSPPPPLAFHSANAIR